MISRLLHARPRSRGHAGPRSRGQAVVEFAVILPVFLVITLGIVDVTRMFNAYVSLENGVREAAIFAAAGDNYTKWCLDPADSAGRLTPPAVSVPCPLVVGGFNPLNYSRDPENIAYRVAGEAIGLDTSTVVLAQPACDNGACNDSSLTVTISASYDFHPFTAALVGFINLAWPNGVIPLKASTTAAIMR